jgi:hypothetical protein
MDKPVAGTVRSEIVAHQIPKRMNNKQQLEGTVHTAEHI